MISKDNIVLFIAYIKENVYTMDFNDLPKQNVKCFAYLEDISWLWHRPLGHASMELIRKSSHKEQRLL